MVSSQKTELSLMLFNEKEYFCVESASQWILCCKDFLSALSLTFGSKPPKDTPVFTVAITPGARISILKKINMLSAGILTLNLWVVQTHSWLEKSRAWELPFQIVCTSTFHNQRNKSFLFLIDIHYQIFQFVILV